MFSFERALAGDIAIRRWFAELHGMVGGKPGVARQDVCSQIVLTRRNVSSKEAGFRRKAECVEATESTPDLRPNTWTCRQSNRTRCSDDTSDRASKWSSWR